MKHWNNFLIGFLVGLTPAQQQNVVTGFAIGLQEALNQPSNSGILEPSDKKAQNQQKNELKKSSNEASIQSAKKTPKRLKSKL
jgi:hypothetical protein